MKGRKGRSGLYPWVLGVRTQHNLRVGIIAVAAYSIS